MKRDKRKGSTRIRSGHYVSEFLEDFPSSPANGRSLVATSWTPQIFSATICSPGNREIFEQTPSMKSTQNYPSTNSEYRAASSTEPFANPCWLEEFALRKIKSSLCLLMLLSCINDDYEYLIRPRIGSTSRRMILLLSN